MQMNHTDAVRIPDIPRFTGDAHYPAANTERHLPNIGIDDLDDDYPMISALYASYQAHCLQQQARAELRGDDPADAVAPRLVQH
jgi:hypothetical protein